MIEILTRCISENFEVRINAYDVVANRIPDWDGEEFSKVVFPVKSEKIIYFLKKDIENENEESRCKAISFLECIIANEKFISQFSIIEEQDLFDTLLKFLENVENDEIKLRTLSKLSQNKFDLEILCRNLSKLLSLIEVHLSQAINNDIVSESLLVLKSVVKSIPEEALDRISLWFSCIFPCLFHGEKHIRGTAYNILKLCLELNHLNKSIFSLFQSELTLFIPQLQNTLCKRMEELVMEKCEYVLEIWKILVQVLGEKLHHGIHLINGFLSVVEKAFKSPKDEFRVEAFKCWRILISNFSLDKSILCHPKKIKLLIAPFQISNAKSEAIVYEKLKAWWFLICNLEEKARDNFDLVVCGLLKFCFSSNLGVNPGKSERIYLLSNAVDSCKKYSNLHISTAEVFARIISPEIKPLGYDFSVEEPNILLINSNLFLRNYQLFFAYLEDILRSLNSENTKEFILGCLIMKAMMHHVVNFVNSNPNRKEAIDIVKELFITFSKLESHCQVGDSHSRFAFKFLEMTIIGEFAFSKRILNSRLYHIPTGTKVRELMNGTLSNFLIHKLCKPSLLYFSAVHSKEFLTLWETVLISGNPGKLVFIELVIEELNDVVPVLCPQNSASFVSLWSTTAHFLDSYINETLSINQGDNSEYDWSCIYNTLLLPIKSSHDYLSSVDLKCYESMLNTWSMLWKHFVTLTTFIITAEPNAESEIIASEMNKIVSEKFSTPPDVADFSLMFFSDIAYVMIDEFKFKELGKKSKKMMQSPLKPKKKPHPLFNLYGIVNLVNVMMEKAIRMISSKRHKIMLKLCATLSKLFKNVTHDGMIWPLLTILNDSIYKALQVNPAAKFNQDVELKFIEMWSSYCSLVENCLARKLSKDQFTFLTPLICASLQSSHSGIRQRTRILWTNAFASTHYNIPKNMFEILRTLGLPPASFSEILEDNSQSQSFVENDRLPISGSFLRKEPFLRESPRSSLKMLRKVVQLPTLVKSPAAKLKEFKLKSVDEMRDEDFVRVNSPKATHRIFTSHQVDKMRTRACDIPALYNDLSQSVSQIPSQFMGDGSFDDIMGNSESNTKKESMDKGVPALTFPKLPFPKFVVTNKQCSPIKNYRTSLDTVATNKSSISIADFSLDKLQKVDCSKADITFDSKESPDDVDKTTEMLGNFQQKISEDAENKSEIMNERNGKENKRKSKTPVRKSIEDIRTILKRKLPESFIVNNPKSSDLQELCNQVDKNEISNISPVANSLTGNDVKLHLSSTKCLGPEIESDDEIPCSQVDSPSGINVTSLERPRRNKRGRCDDDIFYVTPTKNLKISAISNNFSCKSSTYAEKKDGVPQESLLCNSLVTSKDFPDVTSIIEIPTESLSEQLTQITSANENCTVKVECILKQQKSTKKSCQGLTEPKQLVKSTPSKVTRSGRRIVAPNREIPEPMTPPSGNTSRSLLSFDYQDKLCPKSSPFEFRKKSTQRRISDSFEKTIGNMKDKSLSSNKLNTLLSPKINVPTLLSPNYNISNSLCSGEEKENKEDVSFSNLLENSISKSGIYKCASNNNKILISNKPTEIAKEDDGISLILSDHILEEIVPVTVSNDNSRECKIIENSKSDVIKENALNFCNISKNALTYQGDIEAVGILKSSKPVECAVLIANIENSARVATGDAVNVDDKQSNSSKCIENLANSEAKFYVRRSKRNSSIDVDDKKNLVTSFEKKRKRGSSKNARKYIVENLRERISNFKDQNSHTSEKLKMEDLVLKNKKNNEHQDIGLPSSDIIIKNVDCITGSISGVSSVSVVGIAKLSPLKILPSHSDKALDNLELPSSIKITSGTFFNQDTLTKTVETSVIKSQEVSLLTAEKMILTNIFKEASQETEFVKTVEISFLSTSHSNVEKINSDSVRSVQSSLQIPTVLESNNAMPENEKSNNSMLENMGSNNSIQEDEKSNNSMPENEKSNNSMPENMDSNNSISEDEKSNYSMPENEESNNFIPENIGSNNSIPEVEKSNNAMPDNEKCNNSMPENMDSNNSILEDERSKYFMPENEKSNSSMPENMDSNYSIPEDEKSNNSMPENGKSNNSFLENEKSNNSIPENGKNINSLLDNEKSNNSMPENGKSYNYMLENEKSNNYMPENGKSNNSLLENEKSNDKLNENYEVLEMPVEEVFIEEKEEDSGKKLIYIDLIQKEISSKKIVLCCHSSLESDRDDFLANNGAAHVLGNEINFQEACKPKKQFFDSLNLGRNSCATQERKNGENYENESLSQFPKFTNLETAIIPESNRNSLSVTACSSEPLHDKLVQDINSQTIVNLGIKSSCDELKRSILNNEYSHSEWNSSVSPQRKTLLNFMSSSLGAKNMAAKNNISHIKENLVSEMKVANVQCIEPDKVPSLDLPDCSQDIDAFSLPSNDLIPITTVAEDVSSHKQCNIIDTGSSSISVGIEQLPTIQVENEVVNIEGISCNKISKVIAVVMLDEEDFTEVSSLKVDRDSPSKAEESRLTSSIGTPELKMFSLSKKINPSSRAALMLAHAKRTRKPRAEDESLSEKLIDIDDSLQVTPTTTPPRKKRKFSILNSETKPWAKHKPSPNASPSSSILKRKNYEDDLSISSVGKLTELGEGSPSLASNRRVSFADPPVSEKVEIPTPSRNYRGIKAQKKLDMTHSNIIADVLVVEQESQNEDLLSLNPLDCSQPIFSSLNDCHEPIELLAPLLTSPSLVDSLIAVFLGRDLKTVGDFCSISEAELHTLPVRSPKTSCTKKCLNKFIEIMELRNKQGIKDKDMLNSGTCSTTENVSSMESNSDTRSTDQQEDLNAVSISINPLDVKVTEKTKNDISNKADISALNEEDQNFVKSFCQHLEKDSGTISSFASGLTSEIKEKLFSVLTETIPYKNIINLFHKYLQSQDKS